MINMTMTDKTIENARIVGGDYFRLAYVRKSQYKLDYYTNQFNWDDYWCYKSTNNQKYIPNEQDFQDFKYSCYIFFNKDLYNKDNIDMWIEYMKSIGGIQYLNKQLPPFNPYKKIIIMK